MSAQPAWSSLSLSQESPVMDPKNIKASQKQSKSELLSPCKDRRAGKTNWRAFAAQGTF